MGEGLILDPLAASGQEQQLDALVRRVTALEQRPQVQAWDAVSVFPEAAVQTDWYINVTSATFAAQWTASLARTTHQGLYVSVPWQTEAGTTGEMRLKHGASGSVTSTVALAAASSGIQVFRWLITPFLRLWEVGYNVGVETRRTGGANNVRVGASAFFLVDGSGATLTGV